MDTNIYLCGQTALEIWQLVRCLWNPRLNQLLPLSGVLKQMHIGPVRVERIEKCSLSPEQTRHRAAESLGYLCERLVGRPLYAADRRIELSGINPAPAIDAIVGNAPLELMANIRGERRSGAARRFHVFTGPAPDTLFVDLGGGVFVTAPQHTLAQLASGRSPAELAMLAFELRGAYATDRFAKAVQSDRCLPLFCEDDVAEMCDVAAALRGTEALHRALGLSLDQAVSVAEAGMVLLLCAPRRLGGYGMPWPEMNACLPIPGADLRFVDWPWVACDAYWRDADTVLEYDGGVHKKAWVEKRDKRRKNVLSTLGLHVFTVDAAGLIDFDRFDQSAHQVAKSIGFRFDKRFFDAAWKSRCAALRTEVIKLAFGEEALMQPNWY